MFDIVYKDASVGYAQVKKEGLYYIFSCTCTPPDNEIYRVIVSDGSNRQDLGICVPEGGQFVINKRIACKTFHGDSFAFSLGERSGGEISVPVADGKPFGYLEQLESASLRSANGQIEIVIAPTQGLQDSDQNQEYPHKWESL